jgi:hypothetical protein
MSERPTTIVGLLNDVVAYLDLADKAFDTLAAAKGVVNPAQGNEVQQDLRRLAQWFASNPGIDARVFQDITAAMDYPRPRGRQFMDCSLMCTPETGHTKRPGCILYEPRTIPRTAAR